MKWPLLHQGKNIPEDNSPGSFGFKRSYYYHPGVDLYCEEDQEVIAIEDGVVVNIEIFTGPNATPMSPWWNETWSILVEGESGVIGYCEIEPHHSIVIGEQLKEGDIIGHVIPVLKKDKGNGCSMIHLEKYKAGTKGHVTWHIGQEKPDELEDPTELLESINTDSLYIFNHITKKELLDKYPADQEGIWTILPFTSFFHEYEELLTIKGKYSKVVEYVWNLENFREKDGREVGYIIPIKIDVDLT